MNSKNRRNTAIRYSNLIVTRTRKDKGKWKMKIVGK